MSAYTANLMVKCEKRFELYVLFKVDRTIISVKIERGKMELFFGLIVAAGLAFIPANIAKNKGYSFGLWWFYGWMLFIVAIIHVNFIPDKNAPQIPINTTSVADSASYTPNYGSIHSAADELKKHKELLDAGILTQEEFEAQKKKILKL